MSLSSLWRQPRNVNVTAKFEGGPKDGESKPLKIRKCEVDLKRNPGPIGVASEAKRKGFEKGIYLFDRKEHELFIFKWKHLGGPYPDSVPV